MKRKTRLTKLGRDPLKQKGFINPGTYKGSTMIFKGTSSRGTLTTDTYSLKGFTAAYRSLKTKCKF